MHPEPELNIQAKGDQIPLPAWSGVVSRIRSATLTQALGGGWILVTWQDKSWTRTIHLEDASMLDAQFALLVCGLPDQGA